MVQLIAVYGSLTKLAKAHGRTISGLRSYLAIRPELRARLEEARPAPAGNAGRCRRYNETHRDERRAEGKARYHANRAEELAANKRWLQANPHKVRANKRRAMAADPARYRTIAKRSRERNRDAVLARHRRHYLARTGNHDAESAAYVQILIGDPCSYCGRPVKHIDHIASVQRGGDGHWSNLTGACASCNTSKGAKPLLVFLLDRLPA